MLQIPSLILPIWTALRSANDLEVVNDLVTHVSDEFPVEWVQEKALTILATEIIIAGTLGTLLAWVELSPYPSANNPYWAYPLPASTAYWGAIGGGGGALVPTVPSPIVPTQMSTTIHTLPLAWTAHSGWARVVVRMPVNATPTTALWWVQVLVSGK